MHPGRNGSQQLISWGERANTEDGAVGFNIFYIILDMRNKVVVILVVALCVWLTLEGPATRKPQRRREEDDSDL